MHCGLCAAELRDSRHRAAQTPPLSPACGSCRVFALAALYLDTALPSLLAGKEPFAGIVELFYQLEDAYKQAGLDISSLQLSTEVLPEVFYGVLIALAEGVGFLTVVLAKWFSTKAKADVRPMAPFVRWQLPSSLRIGMPMIAAAIILMFILNYGGAETVMNTAFGLFMPLFAATGIASFIYIFSRNRPNQSVSPFAVVLMIFVICFSPFLLAGFGLVELYTGFRLKMMRVDDKIRAAFEKAEREGSSVVSVDLDDGQGPRIIAVRKNVKMTRQMTISHSVSPIRPKIPEAPISPIMMICRNTAIPIPTRMLRAIRIRTKQSNKAFP